MKPQSSRPFLVSRNLPSIPSALLVFATALSGCGSSPGGAPPGRIEAWPGSSVVLRASGRSGGDVSWTDESGSWQAEGAEVRFAAPAASGDYVLHARGDGRSDVAITVHVRPVGSTGLVIDSRTATAVSGRRGDVTFEAHREGESGAVATFTVGAPGSGVSTVEARVVDGTTGSLTIDGVALDGHGELTDAEATALRTLGLDPAFEALALVPLDLACEDDAPSVQVLAALLLPWQLVSKYETADRMIQAVAFEQASRCRHFMSTTLSDPREGATSPVLSNGRAMPAAFGYLPLDAVAALEDPSGIRKSTDVDVYGPGGSLCRGACGPDCEETNCGEPEETFRCEVVDGRNTGLKLPWRRYTCGEHPGCVAHDGCFDQCNQSFGAKTVDAFLCMRVCDVEAISGYGALQGLDWALGHGPFTHERSYDYLVGEPIRDEVLCPPGFGLWVTPSGGLAPLSATIHWDGPTSLGGACELDPGDGSAPIVIDPCTASGERPHVYAAPSALHSVADVYTATLSHAGAVVAQGDVQATWTFGASVTSGPADLATTFSWDGFSGATTPLTCTLEFGDGSAPLAIDDCANAAPVDHTYGHAGTFVAVLSVAGGARTASEFTTIVVTAATDGFEGVAYVDEGAIQIQAQVTWTLSEDFDGVVQYVPSGLVTYSMAGCSLSPASHAIVPDDGYMEVDVTYDPHRYYGGGVTSWEAVLTCGEQSSNWTVIAHWFEGSAIYEASEDGNTLAATHSYWSWNFARTN